MTTLDDTTEVPPLAPQRAADGGGEESVGDSSPAIDCPLQTFWDRSRAIADQYGISVEWVWAIWAHGHDVDDIAALARKLELIRVRALEQPQLREQLLRQAA